MAWISWKRMAAPKALGGLGLRDINAFNDALLAKISWRILTNPQSLLARVLLGKYCVENSFRECTPVNSSSHGWRGILAGRDVLLKKLIFSIGNGESTKIWSDPWIEGIKESKPHGPSTCDLEDATVRSLLSADGREWDKAKVEHFFPSLENEILNIKISKHGAKDTLFWSGSRDGTYTVKSGYFALMEEEFKESQEQSRWSTDWPKRIWNIACAPKVRIFLWRLFNHALPVGESLQVRGILDHGACVRCGEEETLRHVFFDCPYANRVWQLSQWKMRPSFNNVSLEEAIMSSLNLIALPPSGVGNGPLAPWILWSLWKSRNFLVFQKRSFSQDETLIKAIGDAREWQVSQIMKTTVSTGSRLQAQPQDQHQVDTATAFTDAAWSSSLKLAGLGVVMTDPFTTRNQTYSGTADYVSSPLIGEVLAIVEALERAIDLGYSRLHVYSDSKISVDAINTSSDPRELYGILSDIRILSSYFHELSFSFVPRDQNFVADSIAKNSLRDFILCKELVVPV